MKRKSPTKHTTLSIRMRRARNLVALLLICTALLNAAVPARRALAAPPLRAAATLNLLLPGSSALAANKKRPTQPRNTTNLQMPSAGNVSNQFARTNGDDIWQDVNEGSLVASKKIQSNRVIIPEAYRTLSLNREAMTSQLSRAPVEFTEAAAAGGMLMLFPLPDGTFGRFRVYESSVMSPELAAQYPQLKTYRGEGLDDPTATVRFDNMPDGFHAMILSARGTFYIDPYSKADSSTYISYRKLDYTPDEKKSFECLFNPAAQNAGGSTALKQALHGEAGIEGTPATISPTMLRSYRTVISATSAYVKFQSDASDTADQARVKSQAAIVKTMNRINGIFEREVMIRLMLVQTLIFTDQATDPFNGLGASAALEKNQPVTDQMVGSANYDLGHVFGQAASTGGVAILGGVCDSGAKAKAATLSSAPRGDAFDVDFAAHEFGHQFGANHTYNESGAGSCKTRNAATAYEPASGSTIMSYTNICDPRDLQPKSDDYFHAVSIQEMLAQTTTGSSSCGQPIGEVNNPPTVDAGATYTIPARTPFMLTATGSDPDAQDQGKLTYDWEEYDLGPPAPPDTDDGKRPIFRSYNPTTSTSRLFPSLKYILDNANNPPQIYTLNLSGEVTKDFITGETLPVTDRTMKFRVTARDNRSGGGASSSSDTSVTVVSTAGPFAITQPNTNVTWTSGTQQTITWNVAATNAAPINASNVRITLSNDGGQTFPIVLAASVPNNGSTTITVPNEAGNTTTARVKVEAVGNIFFDVSDTNFTLNGATACATTVTPTSQTINATGGTGTINVTTAAGCGYTATSNSDFITIATGASGSGNGMVTYTVAPSPSNDARTGTISVAGQTVTITQTGITVQFSSPTFTVSEGGGSAVITVTRTGNGASAATVDYATSDGSAQQKNRYIGAFGTLRFAAGEISKTFAVLIIDNAIVDGNQTANLTLSNPTGLSLGTQSTAVLTINDNDTAPPTTNPIDDTNFFVRQQYLDFLNREPDSGGFAYWTNMINGCGGDANCINSKRITVSAAFFIEQEFQETGNFVYRLYKASYGVRPTYQQFVQDRGRLVADANLEASKQDFANQFVQRTTFLQAYPANLSNADFVNKLFDTASLKPYTAERQEQINAMNTSGKTRAQVLRAVVEISQFRGREFNPAFVLLQYFGYLRRDPDEAGYQFWLDVLNNKVPDNFRAMVCAFITSKEYQDRFSPVTTRTDKICGQ